MKNPRFSGKVTIKRILNTGEYPNIQKTVKTILVSKCGYRNLSSEDISFSSGVYISQYKIALPRFSINVITGDLIEVICNNETRVGTVVKAKNNNLGAYVWFNEV